MVANNKCYLQKQRTLAHFAGIRSGRFHTSECRQLRTGQCEVKSCIFTSEWTVSLIRRERNSDARKPTDYIYIQDYTDYLIKFLYLPRRELIHESSSNLSKASCSSSAGAGLVGFKLKHTIHKVEYITTTSSRTHCAVCIQTE